MSRRVSHGRNILHPFPRGITCPDHPRDKTATRLIVSAWIGWLYRNVDVIDAAGRLGNRGPVFAKPGEMKIDCLAKNRLGFFDGSPGRDAAWEIRRVARKIVSRLFNHDRVAHVNLTS